MFELAVIIIAIALATNFLARNFFRNLRKPVPSFFRLPLRRAVRNAVKIARKIR